ncbi:MAG TPA: M90 family metallopeptidase [Planctomycetaceae bacterium]
MFSFLKRRRRRKLLAEPFPPAWEAYLAEDFHQFALLPAPLRTKLRDRLRVFLAEKYWEGVSGFEVTDEMRVVVSAMACTLTLAFDESVAYYPKVVTVLIHGEHYSRKARRRWAGGVVSEGEEWRLGEAWDLGPVGLSWPDVVEGGLDPDDGFNLVYHEFAHALDMIGGAADGVPPLPSGRAEREWSAVLGAELDALRSQRDAGRGIPLDDYALTNEAEFFSVATESYFERPRLLRLKLPRLYGLLDSFYRLSPAEW